MIKPPTINTRDVMKGAIEKLSKRDFLGAVQDYEELLTHAPNFISALLKNHENRRFHEIMAKHSLIQQAFRQTNNEGYSVDIGPYLFSNGGKMRIRPEIAKDIALLKGSPFKRNVLWASHVAQVQEEYRDTLLSGFGKPEEIDWSPVYLALWVLNDFFKSHHFFRRPFTVSPISAAE